MSIQYKLIHCTINGKEVEQMVDVRASLTDMLRNDFRLTRRRVARWASAGPAM